jgi:hypothetical protein
MGFGAAVQTDGKIVVVGERSNGDNQDILMIRLTSGLDPDAGFGDSGIVTYTGTGNENNKGFAVAVQGDGKIVAAGAHIAAGQEKEDLLILSTGTKTRKIKKKADMKIDFIEFEFIPSIVNRQLSIVNRA